MTMVKNAAGRLVPDELPGIGSVRPFEGVTGVAPSPAFNTIMEVKRDVVPMGTNKIAPDLRTAIERSGLCDGMTISFHHHLRNGDRVVAQVLEELNCMGFKNLVLMSSALLECHNFVVDYIRSGLIRQIYAPIRGAVGDYFQTENEKLPPVIIRTHGGRARAVEEGSIAVDVAFIGASACDMSGNMTGMSGPSAFGSLGYGMQDARFSRHVIAVTDNLVEYPLRPRISIPQYLVHQVVVLDSIGDPQKLATGSVRITKSPTQLALAYHAYELMAASGAICPGFSYQAGGGGISMAVTQYVREYMQRKDITGSFALGGITADMVSLLEEGRFQALFDVQSFDPAMGASMLRNPTHYEIDASWYANPLNAGCMTHQLDVAVLGALDVDVDFNVNLLTGHDGYLRSGMGGHPDAAVGAKLTVVVLPSFRRGLPSIKKSVQTICTPGASVDAIVTERGICINPRREDLLKQALDSGLNVGDIEKLRQDTEALTGVMDPVEFDESRVAAVVDYRDGSILDVVYGMKR